MLEIARRRDDVHQKRALYVRKSGAAWRGFQARLVDGEARGEFRHLLAHALLDDGVADVQENFGDPRADLVHFRLAHPARGYRWAGPIYSAGLHRRERVEGNGVFVYGDSGAVERFFRIAAGQAAGVQFDEEKVIVRSAGHNAKSLLGNRCREGPRVDDDLLLIVAETRFHGFCKAHRFRGDHVAQRSALHPGECQPVDFFGEGGAAKHHAGARTAQRFVRGGRDDVRVRHGAGRTSRGTWLGCTPAAAKPAMWAMSTKNIASTALAILPMRSKSMMREYALAPATIMRGLCSCASFSTSS